MRIAALALTALLLVGAAAPAGAETLREAMLGAVHSSPRLGAERARLDAVRQEIPLVWAQVMPQISASATAQQRQTSEATFGLQVRDSPEYWIGTVRTSMLIFSSGSVLASSRQANGRVASAVALYQNSAQELMLDVTRAYGEVRYARAVKAAQEQSLANLTRQLDYVVAHVSRGFLTQTDRAQAGVRVAQARAELAQADVELVRATETYLRLVGRPPQDLEEPPSLTGLPPDLTASLELAARENPAIVAAIASAQAADAAVDVARAEGRPRVNLETNNSVFDRTDADRTPTQSEDIAAVRLSIPLFSGGSVWARTRRERYTRDAANFTLAEQQRVTHEQVVVSWSNMSASHQRVEAGRARLDAAQLAARGVLREQEFGQRSVIDVLNQEQDLLRARTDLAAAERDAMIAERQFAASIGRLGALSLGPDAPTPTRRARLRRR
jgi:outer membrane protein